MHDDLLEAQACVDWAVSNLPAFHERLDAWTKNNVEVVIKDQEPPALGKIAVAREKEFLPLAFSVEAGAYINAIRSSLDMLASALARRNGKTGSVELHFPIYRTDLHMLDPKEGIESIKWLSESERTIIKNLEPYSRGNDTLFSLHQLDIMRKHRRLLEVRLQPTTLRICGAQRQHITLPARTVGANGESLLAFISPDATGECKAKATFLVAFDEPGHLGSDWVVLALREFARTATDIIALFDVP